ncbi:protein HGH1 homolog, partial [Empidonax traillii]|uniref:protein HGH1 homolog n=1 Tax=Empidonax traillii TaxID=164674 RepID=UPI000FFD8CF5
MAAAEKEMMEGKGEAGETDEAAAAALSELTSLLSPSSPAAAEAAEAALSLSGSAAGRRLLAGSPPALRALRALAAGPSRGAAAAGAALLNASAEPAAHEVLLEEALLEEALGALLPAGWACGVLANLSREPRNVPRVLRALPPALGPPLLGDPAELPPHLGPLLCNLSRHPQGRAAILDPHRRVVQRLLPLTQSRHSLELRRGVVGALRNCCFEHGETPG